MDILFWSGGKDAWLALEFYRQEHDRSLKLLTTYDEERGIVPHQNIPVDNIRKQARYLDLELLLIPLPTSPSNKAYLREVKKALAEENDISYLVFGDWYLEEIREWREQEFGKMGYECLFPIWEKSIHDLLPVLILKPVEVKITAVKEEYQKYIRVGETYDQAFVRTLPEEIDPMGEKGEFHTEVIFHDLKDKV